MGSHGLRQASVPDAEVAAALVDRRVVVLSAVSVCLALVATATAQLLTGLIGLVTNLAFYGRLSTAFVSPAGHGLGARVLLIPSAGALLVGLMARFGSPAIRGHGIPEAMERVLFAQSRIPPRMTVLKPLSAAISIGTGGPFGAEGPIIATGGALGSLVGQVLTVTADERKTLLAAGAVAGMAATFGTPVSAVLLAIELLLFEYRPRSVIPVALASATASAARLALVGGAPVFTMPDLAQPSGAALASYIVLGAIVGVAAVLVTRALYRLEDGFERLPVHWMWWPALGGLAVGAAGYVAPRTLGVGYDNIDDILAGTLVGRAALVFCAFKLFSWIVALASGTSGGTLAPLFTLGGGLGSVLGGLAVAVAPSLGIDVRIAALVGMAAMFAGASRALLASVVFAFEATRQPIGLLPLLGGCTAAFLVSSLLMKNSIMTEKIARRGARVPSEYRPDFLDQVLVADCATRELVTLRFDQTIDSVRAWLGAGGPGTRHTGFPVLDAAGTLIGVVTRTDLFDAARAGDQLVTAAIKRAPVVISEQSTVRGAADRMLVEGVGRLVVVKPEDPTRVVGIITRSDLLGAHRRRLDEASRTDALLSLRKMPSVSRMPGIQRLWSKKPPEPPAPSTRP
ncbi:chloride channel protein [Polyangium sp. 6x1]|uniref:chloride channel protein n=1 Tax=Polyangium sp. 6x1 TaxID=3042689 RepID=UPI0024827B6D|nr:chloride channel protein [Polyangium sp. 6x1]MDI1446963.1 chloride channel protein [Polyangium sp. 6x1]